MSKTQNSKTGGRLIVDSLLAHGVDAVFCEPGESYLEVIDALYDVKDRIKLITCRHENGAAYMAEAYAKLTGKTGVCMASRGPGACNAAIGVHTAFQDSTPMILLIGQAPRPFLGRGCFQADAGCWVPPAAPWATAFPVIEVGARRVGKFTVRAGMLAPEATMHKDHFPAARKYHVGAARKAVAVKPVTVAHAVGKAADGKLGLHIFTANRPHHPASDFRRYPVLGVWP